MNHVMIRPYNNNETAQDPSKALFNKVHSRIRTVMTENIFGIWVKRFPVIKNMRSHLQSAQKIILCSAILHNMAMAWGDTADDLVDPPGADLPLPPRGPPTQAPAGADGYNEGSRMRDTLRQKLWADRRAGRV